MIAWILISVCALSWFGFDVGRKRLSSQFTATQLMALASLLSVVLATPFFVWGLLYSDPNAEGLHRLYVASMPPATMGYWKFVIAAAAINLFSNWLFVRAVEVSPFSLTLPYLSLSPVFAAVLSFLFSDAGFSGMKIFGIALVFLGSFFLNPGEAGEKRDWLGPIKALGRERGSLYMIVVAACWAVAIAIDNKVKDLTTPLTHIYVVSFILMVGYGVIVAFKDLPNAEVREQLKTKIKSVPGWLVFTGFVALLAQVAQVATTASVPDFTIIEIVKRAVGVIGSVIVGYLLFNEKDVKQRLVGASVMTIGVIIVLTAKTS